jgi:hypothetical protein
LCAGAQFDETEAIHCSNTKLTSYLPARPLGEPPPPTMGNDVTVAMFAERGKKQIAQTGAISSSKPKPKLNAGGGQIRSWLRI